MIVGIDEKSLAAEGQWPWQRARIADLVRGIEAAGEVVKVGEGAAGANAPFKPGDRASQATEKNLTAILLNAATMTAMAAGRSSWSFRPRHTRTTSTTSCTD